MVLIVVGSFSQLANVNSICSKVVCSVQVVGVDETVCGNREWLVVGVNVCGVTNGTLSYRNIREVKIATCTATATCDVIVREGGIPSCRTARI